MGEKHTPGPWYQFGCGVTDENPKHVKPGTPLNLIAATGDDCDPGDESQQIANARLIAAAPELLAALNDALPLLEGFEDADMHEDDEVPIVAPVLAKVRAAIAKAEGRS